MKDLLGAIGATAAATRHPQAAMKFAQGTGATAYRVADLPFGYTVAEANVHGWVGPESLTPGESDSIVIAMRMIVNK